MPTGSFGSSSCILYNKVKNKVKISGVDVGSELDHFNSAYFIGIGGAGMSALARILVDMKVRVAGSDLKASRNTARLEQFGAKIFIGHQAQNLDDVDIVIISSATVQISPAPMVRIRSPSSTLSRR
ncbi:UDP-N-acetylmuramate--alanine ligase [Candidatus Hakubella thermalkaliphila]|uniref:UDP-N-acetylmuramate--alanine ligase n=1 Tax=Candidatus Hakubella thermalkaliphila TaxID=2754717 RepID=A0A6V8PJS3_9ACTN|nr:UDP-N-acetylmuramate--alanine ligase [Candidatus Hakubella thermalkaliphila]